MGGSLDCNRWDLHLRLLLNSHVSLEPELLLSCWGLLISRRVCSTPIWVRSLSFWADTRLQIVLRVRYLVLLVFQFWLIKLGQMIVLVMMVMVKVVVVVVSWIGCQLAEIGKERSHQFSPWVTVTQAQLKFLHNLHNLLKLAQRSQQTTTQLISSFPQWVSNFESLNSKPRRNINHQKAASPTLVLTSNLDAREKYDMWQHWQKQGQLLYWSHLRKLNWTT